MLRYLKIVGELCKLQIVLVFALIASANAGLLPAAAPLSYAGFPTYPYASIPYNLPAAYSALPIRAAPVAPAVVPAASVVKPAPFATVPAVSPIVRTAVPAIPAAAAAVPVAKAVAAPVPVAAARLEYDDAYPQYQYAYSIQDALTGDSKAQEEVRDGGVVKGRYSLIEADGSRRTVNYYADPFNGFNAIVQKDLPVLTAPVGPVIKKAPAIVSV
ncbi:hypothetical protein PGB90_002981 [Kerria lacca]